MYTQSMTAELHSIGSFTYETAAAFAEKHGISTRSVISKVKFEQLPYETKAAKAPKAKRVRKSEIVGMIAQAINVPLETIEGLDKADMASLKNLLGNI